MDQDKSIDEDGFEAPNMLEQSLLNTSVSATPLEYMFSRNLS